MYTPKKHEPVRIGFYICHCGTNIAAMVDVQAVAKYVATLPNVVRSIRGFQVGLEQPHLNDSPASN